MTEQELDRLGIYILAIFAYEIIAIYLLTRFMAAMPQLGIDLTTQKIIGNSGIAAIIGSMVYMIFRR